MKTISTYNPVLDPDVPNCFNGYRHWEAVGYEPEACPALQSIIMWDIRTYIETSWDPTWDLDCAIFVNTTTGQEIPGDSLCEEMRLQLHSDPEWETMF